MLYNVRIAFLNKKMQSSVIHVLLICKVCGIRVIKMLTIHAINNDKERKIFNTLVIDFMIFFCMLKSFQSRLIVAF